MGDIIRLNQDDGNYFVPSDSEDDYSETEKMLLEKVRAGRKGRYQGSDDEVLGIHSGNDSDDNDDVEDMASDLDGQEEGDGLPDPKAWGKKRKTFHHTDYVDEDYGGFQGKDAEDAEFEEQEARAIQERLAQQLDEQDFSLDIFVKPSAPKDDEAAANEELIKTDLTKLSKRQKLALLEKESPEFLSLVEDFKARMTEVQDKLRPMLALIKEGKIPPSSACDFVRTKYHLNLNYCTNIAFYVLLKTQRISIQSHPVVRRLFQYRQLLKQLEPLDEVMTPQINFIIETVKAGKPLVISHPDKIKLDRRLSKNSKKEEKEIPYSPPIELRPDPVEEDEVEEDDNEAAADEGVSKRGIPYQIAKNKGITPRRKKEQRNPRVKHRNRYHRAVIRRKGQVREPRKEIQKYGGEISGIKIGVSKSIKLK